MYAHSAATLLAPTGIQDTGKTWPGDVDSPYPTISEQITCVPEGGRAGVQLILMNGCINDIGPFGLVSPTNSSDWVRKHTQESCGAPVEAVLRNVANLYPQSEEALTEPDEVEDGVDQHAPVDVLLTVEILELRRHHHVHIHKCRHVAVEINFNGRTKRHRFSPATTIGVVTRWARKKFKLDGAAGAEYVLQVCKSIKQPRSDEHLGELVEPPVCSICFDLVKEITPQG